MKVTWIIPDTYGFLVDELEGLSSRLQGIRVLSGCPVPPHVQERLSKIEFHHCPGEAPWKSREGRHVFRHLAGLHGWGHMWSNRSQIRKIAGIYRTLHRLEKEVASDVIHSHFAYPAGVGGTLRAGPAQVLTLRGYDILTTGNYGALWNPFYRQNLIACFEQNHPVTAGCRFTLSRARQTLGSRARLRLLHQGVSLTTWKPAGRLTRESLRLLPEVKILLSVGNLVEVKNPRLLIRAFAGLCAASATPLHLLICGDGPLRGELESLCRSLQVGEKVQFMGKIPREELTDLFGIADLFVHTSMSEGFGNVITEAFLHRLPVVASPVGIAPELIVHAANGYLPELGDLKSWVDCLTLALRSLDELTAGASATRERVLEEFSMDRRIDGYLGIYQEALLLQTDDDE